MSKADRPWVMWFWSDWRADPGLRLCSLAARGLWADLLSLMHEGVPYGHLTVNGKPPSSQQLASLLQTKAREIDRLIAELISKGVPGVNADGTLYSRRMVRDRAKLLRDVANGSTGGNPNIIGGVNPPVNPAPTGEVNGGDNTHIPESISHKPKPNLEEETAWKGRIIRLSRRDYDKWRSSYDRIDINAELQSADDYYAQKPPAGGKWFFAVSRWLKKANDEAKARAAPAAEGGWDGVIR